MTPRFAIMQFSLASRAAESGLLFIYVCVGAVKVNAH